MMLEAKFGDDPQKENMSKLNKKMLEHCNNILELFITSSLWPHSCSNLKNETFEKHPCVQTKILLG